MVKLYYVKITRCATNKTYDLKKERRGTASHGEGAENTVTTKWSEHSELEHNFNWNFKTLDLKSTIQSFLISCFLDTLLNLFFFRSFNEFSFQMTEKIKSIRKCPKTKDDRNFMLTEMSQSKK